MESEIITRMWIIIAALAFIQLVMLFAQVKLFEISGTLKEILKELKTKNNPKPKETEQSKNPDIFSAINADSIAMVQNFIESGASLKVVNNRGENPLEAACRMRNEKIIDLIKNTIERRGD